MKYIKLYESWVNMDHPIVKMYEKLNEDSKPYVDYLKEYFEMSEIEYSSLELFVADFLNGKPEKKTIEYVKKHCPDLEIKLKRNTNDVRDKATININYNRILISFDGNIPISMNVTKLIRTECSNGKKLINLALNSKEYKVSLRIKHSMFPNRGDKDLFYEHKDLYSITNALDKQDKFDYNIFLKLMPYVIKFGTDEEIKRFWKEFKGNRYQVISFFKRNNNIKPKWISKTERAQDYTGFYDRFVSLCSIDDDSSISGVKMHDMGF